MIKDKRSIKVIIVFIGIMVLCTFFSRSILYFFTPKIIMAKPQFESQGTAYTIPAYALVKPNAVYLVQMRDGIFDKILYIEQREVEVSLIEDGQAIITNGITISDTIVTGWDRELKNGQRVLLPLK